MKYFLLTWKTVVGSSASGVVPKDIGMDDSLLRSLSNSTELPFDFTLVKITPEANGLEESKDLSSLSEIWFDYMPNYLAWPLLSPKMKEIVDVHLTHDEELYWLSATIHGDQETREYFVPRFGRMHDVLDCEKTVYVPGTKHVIKPCFASVKLNHLSIFPLPQEFGLWRITSSLYVSESLKMAFTKSGITGVAFEQAAVS
jgi:hypothetical protein